MKKYCQNCGMPLSSVNRGTERDGSPSGKFCGACYSDGLFSDETAALQALTEDTVPFVFHAKPDALEQLSVVQIDPYFPDNNKTLRDL